MTANQLAYLEYQERQRSNLAQELLKRQAQTEVARANLVNEGISRDKADADIRVADSTLERHQYQNALDDARMRESMTSRDLQLLRQESEKLDQDIRRYETFNDYSSLDWFGNPGGSLQAMLEEAADLFGRILGANSKAARINVSR